MSLILHLKRYAIEAMHRNQFKLSFSSSLVRFNEANLTLLLNLESFSHLSLGDKIQLNNCFDYLLPKKKEQIKSFEFSRVDDIVVAGFLEMTGKPRNSLITKCKIRHTFCLLVNIGCDINMSLVTDKNSNALLFWPESLKVVHEKYLK